MQRNLIIVFAILGAFNVFADEITVVEDLLDDGQLQQAITSYKALSELDKTGLRGQLLHSQLLLAQGNIDPAYDLLKNLRDAHQENPRVLYHFAMANVRLINDANIFNKMRYARGALKALRKAEDIAPQDTDVKIALAYYYVNAPAIAGGDSDLAIAYAETVIAMDATLGYPLLLNFYVRLDAEQEIKQTFAKGVELLQDDSQMYYQRAHYFSAQEKWDEAFQDLLQGIKITEDPRSIVKLQYEIGRLAVVSEQRVSLGIASLEAVQASDYDSRPDWTKLRLAQLLLTDGDHKNAKALVATIDSADKQFIKTLKKLSRDIKRAEKAG